MPARLRPLVWLLLALPVMGFWATGLFDLDEGFYGAVVAEMLRRGDWIVPHYNGTPWFEKPILLYWVSAPFVWAFGDGLGPRMASALCFLGVAGALWRFGERFLGVEVGWRAALAFSTSLLAVAVGRMMMTDTPFLLFFTLTLLLFWRSLVEGARWRWLAGACLGASVLAKGPVGGLLFVLVAGWTFWREPELRPAFRGDWLGAVAAFVAVVSLWYGPVYLAEPRLFVDEFLIKQNIGRFTGGDAAHTIGGVRGLVFYLPILAVGAAPWVYLLPVAGPTRRRDLGTKAPFLRYCATWAVIVFVFFTLSGAKLPHYVLPLVPPVALIVGAWMGRRGTRLWGLATGSVAVCLMANVGFWIWYRESGHAELHALTRWAGSESGVRVAEYQMARRESGRGTGGARLMETSHPSIVFYLNRVVPKLESLDAAMASRDAWIILTRKGRLGSADVSAAAAAGKRLSPAPEAGPQDTYAVWRLIPQSEAPRHRPGP